MRAIVFLVFSLLGGAICAAPSVPNLLPDPSFEDKSWWLGTWEECEYKSEYVAESHSGQLAAKLSAIAPGKAGRISAIAISKPAPVTAGQTYLLGLWYRTEPKVTAAVSVIAFSEPFAAQQWKTPQTVYQTYSLPPSEHWRPWAVRVAMPEKSVEAVVLPRVQMVGTAWFDGVSFLPADQAEIKLKTGGEITKLPDARKYEGELTLPEGADLRLDVYRAGDSKPLQPVPATKRFSFTTRAAAGEGITALLTNRKTGAMVAAAELPTPPAIAFQFKYPAYRRTFYASDPRDRVAGTLTAHVSSDLAKKLTYVARLKRPDGTTTTAKPAPLSGRNAGSISLALPQHAPPGKYTLGISVTGGGLEQDFRETFTVAAPAPEGAREVIVGPNNTLLMDGKPFFARGFMGGDASVYGPAAAAGYNVGHSFGGSVESQLKWLDGLQQLGMFGITGVTETYVSKHDLEGLRAAVRAVRSHPALLGYYFPDEPSPANAGQSPADWQPYYDLMVEEDPYHPVMTTMYDPELADDYEPVLDILMFDPYPIRVQRESMTVISHYMTRARELIADRKPIWFVPQAFGYDIVEGREDPVWLTPTPQEERAMTYLGLATGARGLVYYCYHVYTKFDQALQDKGEWGWVLGGYLPEKQPALWGALEEIGRDLQLIAPALDRPSAMWQEGPMFLREIPPVGDEMGYLIAVNSSETERVDKMVRLQTRLPRVHELEELNRRTPCVDVAGSEVRLILNPLQVGIWKLPGRL